MNTEKKWRHPERWGNHGLRAQNDESGREAASPVDPLPDQTPGGRIDDPPVTVAEVKRQRQKRDRNRARDDRILASRVLAARDAGATWPELAEAMGMTRQGLRKFLAREAEA